MFLFCFCDFLHFWNVEWPNEMELWGKWKWQSAFVVKEVGSLGVGACEGHFAFAEALPVRLCAPRPLRGNGRAEGGKSMPRVYL